MKTYDIYAKQNGKWQRKGIQGGGECSGEHIIEVDTLPAVGEEGTIYKTFDAMEIIVKGEGLTLPLLAFYKEFDQVAELYAVSTKPTTNIKVSSATEYYFYYVISENDIFLYTDGTWITMGEFFGGDMPTQFGGVIDSAEAAELATDGYYILGMYVYCEYSNGEWVRYIAPSGSLTVTENGTHDVMYQQYVDVDVPAYIKVDTLPTENIDTNSAYRPDNETIYTFNFSLKGTWLWNEIITTGTFEWDGLVDINTSFESNGETFSNITIREGDYTNTFCHIEYDGKRVYTATSPSSGTWLDDNYRTITFSVSNNPIQDFIIANAVKKTNLWIMWYCPVYGTKQIAKNGTYDVRYYKDVVVNVTTGEGEIPEGYVKPEGEITLTSNGSHDVSGKATAIVDVPIPEGYIKPEGSLPITENGTYPVTDKEEVVVDVPTTTDGVPVEMLNQAVMNELIAPNSTKGDVGAVYLYHGEASDTYEYDALYILEEVSE